MIEHVLDARAAAREINPLCAADGRVPLAFPFEQDLPVYDLPEYKVSTASMRSSTCARSATTQSRSSFHRSPSSTSMLITEGMPLMELKPFPIKFVELRRR